MDHRSIHASWVRRSWCVSLLALAWAVGATGVPDLKSGVFDPPRSAPEFSLRGSDGSDLKLSRYRGKVVALGFGYTSCPDVCPTTLAELAAVKKKLGKAGSDFQVVYVTVDPERDNAPRLKAYLEAFDPTFIGGTGTPQQLAEVRKAYGIVATRMPSQGDPSVYFIGHSSFIYLIDRDGGLRALSPFGRNVDDVVSDVKSLLASDKTGGKAK
jgi:protein SCO1